MIFWPVWEEQYLITEVVEVVVQVNGKLRGKLLVKPDELGDEGAPQGTGSRRRKCPKSSYKVKKFVGSFFRKIVS